MARSLVAVLLTFLFSGYAVAGGDTWEVNDQQKSQKLSPVTSTTINVDNQGSHQVVVQVKNGGTTTSTTVNAGSNKDINVPSGSEVYVVQDGSATNGCFNNMP